MSDDVLKGLQSRSREKMREIWQKAKNDELDDLSDEEKHLAQIKAGSFGHRFFTKK